MRFTKEVLILIEVLVNVPVGLSSAEVDPCLQRYSIGPGR